KKAAVTKQNIQEANLNFVLKSPEKNCKINETKIENEHAIQSLNTRLNPKKSFALLSISDAPLNITPTIAQMMFNKLSRPNKKNIFPILFKNSPSNPLLLNFGGESTL